MFVLCLFCVGVFNYFFIITSSYFFVGFFVIIVLGYFCYRCRRCCCGVCVSFLFGVDKVCMVDTIDV